MKPTLFRVRWILLLLTLAAPDAQADPAASRAAYFVRSLDNPRDRRESRGDILDTPVLPGSVVKTVALVSALENGIITPASTRTTSKPSAQDLPRMPCSCWPMACR